MPDYGVQFRNVGKCLEFIDLLWKNHRALNVDRDNFNQVYIEDYSCTVLVRDLPVPSLDLIRDMVRARIVTHTTSSVPAGERLTINQLLERVMLANRPGSPVDHGLAVAMFKANAEQFQKWYAELLNMGCRDIRVGFVQPTPDNKEMTHLVLIGQAPKSFAPPSDWARHRGWGARALTLYRLRTADKFPFFLEWGYEHPVRGIEHLYDLEAGNIKGVFAFAKGIEEDRGDNDEPGNPAWVLVSESEWRGIFQLPDDLLSLKAADVAPRIRLEPRIDFPEKGVLELRVQKDRSDAASVDSIESQIAWHQQALEQLQRDYRTITELRRTQIYMAYVFEQPLTDNGGEPPDLNSSFSRMLDQPYAHLSNLRYGFFRLPDNPELGLHVILDGRPASYTQVWTQLANEVYIQRLDWYEWNLPLYVRNGDVLRPRLENEEMLPLIRQTFWDHHEHPHHEPVLLRSGGHSDNSRWEALYLSGLCTLTEADVFQFINDRFSANILKFRKDIPEDLQRQLNGKSREISQKAEGIRRDVAHGAEKIIEDIEDKWKLIISRVKALNERAESFDRDIKMINDGLDVFPKDWNEFYLNVLRSNQTLLSNKNKTYQEYLEAGKQLADRIEAAGSTADVSLTELEKDKKTLEIKEKEIDLRLEEIKRLADDLLEREKKAKEKERQISELKRQVSEQIETVAAEKQEDLDRLGKGLEELERKYDELTALENEINGKLKKKKRLHKELQDKKSELERKQKELDDLKAKIAVLQEKLRRMEEELTFNARKYDREKSVVDAWEKDLKAKLKNENVRFMGMMSRLTQLMTASDFLESTYREWKEKTDKCDEIKAIILKSDGDVFGGDVSGQVKRPDLIPDEFLNRIRKGLEK